MDGLVCGCMNRASVREPRLARVCHCAQEAASVPEVLGTGKTRRGEEKDEGGQGGRRAGAERGGGGRAAWPIARAAGAAGAVARGSGLPGMRSRARVPL